MSEQPRQEPLVVKDDLSARIERMTTDPAGYFADARARAARELDQESRQNTAATKRRRKDAGRQRRRQVLGRFRDLTMRAVGGHDRPAR